MLMLHCSVRHCYTPLLSTVLCFLLFGETLKPVASEWWFFRQIQMQTNVSDYSFQCEGILGLTRVQKRLCRRLPRVMLSIAQGIRIGIDECQFQFRNQRWNCTMYGNGFRRHSIGTKEAAVVHALTSAGVNRAITDGCSRGDINNCACDSAKRGQSYDRKGAYKWGGCSDNIRYGSRVTRMFMDAKERVNQDARSVMNIHNNRAGRKTLQRSVRLECKCHGVSGSCTLRTCWQAMHAFRQVGGFIRHKYDKAKQVHIDQDGNRLLLVANNKQTQRRPRRMDLVYFDLSPDYCDHNPSTGSLGTSGRYCRKGTMAADGCNIMCCGRGYDTITVRKRWKCRCKFLWCCRVKCDYCTKWTDVHICKGHGPVTSAQDRAQDRLTGSNGSL